MKKSENLKISKVFNLRNKILSTILVVFIFMGLSSLWSMHKLKEINKELDNLAKITIPITNTTAEVEMELLKQQNIISLISEEKLIIFLEKKLKNEKKVKEHKEFFNKEVKLFKDISKQIDELIKHEIESLKLFKKNKNLLPETNHELDILIKSLKEILTQHQIFDGHVLEFIKSATTEKEIESKLKEILVEDTKLIKHIEEVFLEIKNFTEKAAIRANQHEKEGIKFTTLTNIITGVIGIILGALLAKNILKPLFNLVKKVQLVEDGNLNAQVSVKTKDEIGILGSAFNNMVKELKHKEEIKNIFGQYIDPRIVKDLISKNDETIDEPKKEVVSIFFSDIKQFTTISEQLKITNLVELINRYFAFMSPPIKKQNGLIDKYIGDAIMALWAPPFIQKGTHATQACQAALDSLTELQKFNQDIKTIIGEKEFQKIGFRIGIATGEAVIGSIGPKSSRSFTAMGDTVNTGARLESINKVYGTTILVCEETKKQSNLQFEFREIDTIKLAGKNKGLTIYECLSQRGRLNEKQIFLKENYEKGLAEYKTQNWMQAETYFNNCLTQNSNEKSCILMLNRIEKFKSNPPNKEWNGIWTYKEK